jgi:Macrocin-O-methyltransferase (TylF)
MHGEITTKVGPLAGMSATFKLPARIITYGWGERYVDVLLTFTLPALLAPGNLPYVASQVPCELVILTQRRFFSKFDRHPAIAHVRKFCPVRLVRLDDLIVSKDKYGMTLTYALHRAFSDLGPTMTEHWQIFLNADFILANGSLRTVIGHFARGERIVASPSYCTIAEEVIPELRKHFDPTTSALCISHRELAGLILQHRHTVIRGKTVNQTAFHMRYADQFYWSVDDRTLLGYQMPVSIVGLWPQHHVAEPNSYWDFGLIWEYCPRADVCVIGDSDEFTMLELRDDRVAQDQIILGPLNKVEIAQRMVTWVTPYQQHFLRFPLTLHEGDLPSDIDAARAKLQSFVEEVMADVPPLPSHINHSQWEHHYAQFHQARRMYSRIRSWIGSKLLLAVMPLAGRKAMGSPAKRSIVRIGLERHVKPALRPIVRVGLDRYVRPTLRRVGLEIVATKTLMGIGEQLQEAARLRRELSSLKRESASRSSVEPGHASKAIDSQMFNLEPEFLVLYEQCSQYTTASREQLYALYKSLQYIVANRILGDIVQCDVWRGGSMKLAARALLLLGDTDRIFFLYRAVGISPRGEGIRETVATSGYPMEKLKLLEPAGKQTLPLTIRERIALLCLDSDSYLSTKCEMEHFYPRLSPQGILIINDYGNNQGTRHAIDEYLSQLKKKPLLQRIDDACWLAIKPV